MPATLMAGDAGTGQAVVTTVAVGMVVLELITSVFSPRPPAIESRSTFLSAVSILVVAAIAYFLCLGRSWARWLAVGGGVLAMVGAFARLRSAGDLHQDVELVRRLLLISMVFYGTAVLLLTSNSSVKAFFRARRITAQEQRDAVREWDRMFGLPVSTDESGTDPDVDSDQ